MFKTIDEQIASMARIWPEMRLVERDGAMAAWQGPVRPLLLRYTIQVVYRVPCVIETMNIRRLQPRVSVLTPPLRPRPGDPEGRLPHVWYDEKNAVTLCILDPDDRDWSPVDLLSETTIPWSIEWLAAYEGWRATGVWTASGRHFETAHV